MMRSAQTLWMAVLLGCLLAACASNDDAPHANGDPPLELERFFAGRTTAVGTLSDRSGDVTRRFRVTADGSWSEAERALTVKETWYWDDGEIEPRLWRWEKHDGGRWRGLEDDLVGEATGRALGNIVHWSYAMGVDTRAYGRITISADDRMHLVDPDNIINLVDMYFWGFYVGQVVLHIERGDGRPIEPWKRQMPSPSE
jgi:hypothetical protein